MLEAKKEYENSGKAQLDYLLNRTINDIKYGTTNEKEIRAIKKQANESWSTLPPINGLEDALNRLTGKKKTNRNPQR